MNWEGLGRLRPKCKKKYAKYKLYCILKKDGTIYIFKSKTFFLRTDEENPEFF